MPFSSDPTEQLRAHLRRERSAGDRHPSPERLVAYHERRLSPEEMDEVREHLVACDDCATEVAELAALLDGEEDVEMTPAELDAAWRRQQERRQARSPVVPLAPRGPVAPRRSRAATALLGLAAALLAVVTIVQWRTIERLRQPLANPPLVNLAPAGAVRQGPGVPELRLPVGTERAWVILNPDVELDLPAYDVEVVSADGEPAFRLAGVRTSEAGNVRLEVPGGLLAAGDYRLVLVDERGGERRTVMEFELRVVHDEDGEDG